MKRLITNVLLGATLLLGDQALAQETLIWQFEKGPNPNDVAKRPQASVRFHVPETDIFQAGATCSAYENPGFSNFFFVADVPNLSAGKDVKLRFSGNGRELEVDGKVRAAESEEAAPGVEVKLPNDSPLWDAFAKSSQLSYGVPGFGFNALQLTGGQSSLASFVAACKEFASAGAIPAAGGTNGANPPSGLTEREAFEYARDINTPEAYRTFLERYPSGFFAELAQSALGKLNGTTTTAPPLSTPTAPAKPEFAQLNAGPEATSWIGFDHQETPTAPSYPAAGVEMGGTALIAYCEANTGFRLAFRKQDNGPAKDLDQRILQAQAQNGGVSLQVDGGQATVLSMNVSGLSGIAKTNDTWDPNSELASGIIRGSTLSVSGPSFELNYQLKGSKVNMCSMFQRCGIQASLCAAPQRTQPAVAPPPPRVAPPRQAAPRCRARSVFIEGRGCVLRRSLEAERPRVRPRAVPRCRARSVYIEGRGCVLRRSVEPRRPRAETNCGPGRIFVRGRGCVNRGVTRPRPVRPNNGCRRGQIRFEGRCMRPSDRRGFCGPGFRPQGNRCVRRGADARPVRPRLQDGVFVTERFCRQRGLTKEGNYCVEDD